MHTRFLRACVTGGAGFIGGLLVDKLLRRGLDVSVLDDLSVGRRERVPAGARLVEGDIRDARACTKALEGCDVLFHLAARVAIRSSFEFIDEDASINAHGTAVLLGAAVKAGSIRKVVSTSSMGVYSDSAEPRPIPESHPLEPVAPYGASKIFTEQVTHMMARRHGMQSVVLRLFNTYGPGQTLSPYVGVVTIFVNRLREGLAPVIYGDGLQARDFVHVEDVTDGFLAAMDSDASGITCNIGTGRPTTILQVLETLQRVMGTRLTPVHAALAPGELRYSIADISLARRTFGYQPRREFGASIGDVIEEILGGA